MLSLAMCEKKVSKDQTNLDSNDYMMMMMMMPTVMAVIYAERLHAPHPGPVR